jgi:hypothetical protein
MPINLNDTRIDVNAPQYQRLLTNLQGNILKGHGRDGTVNLTGLPVQPVSDIA